MIFSRKGRFIADIVEISVTLPHPPPFETLDHKLHMLISIISLLKSNLLGSILRSSLFYNTLYVGCSCERWINVSAAAPTVRFSGKTRGSLRIVHMSAFTTSQQSYDDVADRSIVLNDADFIYTGGFLLFYAYFSVAPRYFSRPSGYTASKRVLNGHDLGPLKKLSI